MVGQRQQQGMVATALPVFHLSELFRGTEGDPGEILVSSSVAMGQPRPYAAHERVEDWRLFWPDRGGAPGQWGPVSGRALMERVEARLGGYRKSRGSTYASAFDTYVDFIRFEDVGEFVVRSRLVTPFCD